MSDLAVMMWDDEKTRLQEIVDGLSPTANILEFGSGGSTLFFADNLGASRTLTSVEHSIEWSTKIDEALIGHPARERIRLMYCPPIFEPDVYKFATPNEETPAGLHDYLNPNIDWGEVDLVLVDGLARGAVLAIAALRLAKFARVLLHDYLTRENWYNWIVRTQYYMVRQTHSLLELRLK